MYFLNDSIFFILPNNVYDSKKANSKRENE